MFGAGIIKENSPLNVQATPGFVSLVVALLEHVPNTFGGRVSLNASSVGGHWPYHPIVKTLAVMEQHIFFRGAL